jgi:hypothetical protein
MNSREKRRTLFQRNSHKALILLQTDAKITTELHLAAIGGNYYCYCDRAQLQRVKPSLRRLRDPYKYIHTRTYRMGGENDEVVLNFIHSVGLFCPFKVPHTLTVVLERAVEFC